MSKGTVSKGTIGCAVALAAIAASGTVFTPGALAAPNCPSVATPAPGPFPPVTGGLTVDGTCILKKNIITGGLIVAGTGRVSLQGGTVSGGITVQPGGELDIDATTNGAGAPLTGTTSVVSGGIGLNNPFDVDIWNATIFGGVALTGGNPSSDPTMCGNKIIGGVALRNITTVGFFYFGDPTDNMQFGGKCPGNTIQGSLAVTNSSTGEVEGNSVSDSVLLNGSRLEFNGNTVGGSLACTNGTTILPPERGDPSGNTIGGSRLGC